MCCCWEIKVSVLLAVGALAGASIGAPVKISERFGFDSEDSTRFIQAALDSGIGEVVLDRRKTAWVTKPLFGRSSNQTLFFEDGVELLAKKGEFPGVADALIRYENVTNVSLVGLGSRGGVCRMRKADYHGHPYKKSEWRHGVLFKNAVGFRIENMTVVETGGDGVDILGAGCRNGIVRRVTCDRCNRQGLSVEGCTGLLIEDCVFSNTKGAAPEAGVDFEPFKPDQPMRKIVMRNCRVENNAGKGIGVFYGESNGRTPPYDITVENCHVVGCADGIKVADYINAFRPPERRVRGLLRFRDCTMERCAQCAIRICAQAGNGPRVEFADCTAIEVGGNEQGAEVEFRGMTHDGTFTRSNLPGNVLFDNFVVRKSNPHPWFSCVCVANYSTNLVRGVTGNVHVTGPGGKMKEMALGN